MKEALFWQSDVAVGRGAGVGVRATGCVGGTTAEGVTETCGAKIAERVGVAAGVGEPQAAARRRANPPMGRHRRCLTRRIIAAREFAQVWLLNGPARR